ncbi:YlbG family protein [Lactobacillus xylocopicola]|uniref:DUF2129 domain-containing protein n=1 Tax=Lactobacillus xylocopicola TaxID=2976676 RepID=A0ABM8BGN1_9LACO|nr:YlbG family protein [Lactobacillus xylocopicola]BDR60426.1 hypothetical protein KIM322_06870 [Lactobacillus xylocopicola]
MSINQDLVDTTLTKRQGVVVYLNSVSNQYKLRRYGDIVYFSKKMGYCILYVDQEELDQVIEQLNRLNFVDQAEKAVSDEVDLSSSHIEEQITTLAQEAEQKLQGSQEKNTDHIA